MEHGVGGLIVDELLCFPVEGQLATKPRGDVRDQRDRIGLVPGLDRRDWILPAPD